MKCSACGEAVEARLTQCPRCQSWGTIERWQRLTAVETAGVERLVTGIRELDELLGGGFVAGCVYRVSGPPGCGKSTLALDVACRVPALYAAAEESDGAIRLRFDRIANAAAQTTAPLIGEVTAVEDLTDIPDDVRLVIVDSINRLQSADVAGAAGSNTQLTHAAEQLVALARESELVVLSIAHVNRDGDASGTTRVDHDVDGLLEMAPAGEGGAGELAVKKHRHGPLGAIAVELVEDGIRYEAKEPNEDRKAAEEAAPEEEGVRLPRRVFGTDEEERLRLVQGDDGSGISGGRTRGRVLAGPSR